MHRMANLMFTICIPNYNYEKYLGRTLDSVLSNKSANFEIVVADNASTDSSIKIVEEKKLDYEHIQYKINPVNVGFAANLDRAAALASAERMIMLSSDDLMTSEALDVYQDIIQSYPNAIICSTCDVIDSDDQKIGRIGPNKRWWSAKHFNAELSARLKCDVYVRKSDDLLRDCLTGMGSPFNFCTVAYKRDWYLNVGGYGGGRLINPDKWFHWKLMTIADEAIYIDKPLFKYRWHNQNQNAQQRSSGHLKYMLDEYRSTIEIDGKMLNRAGVTRDEFVSSFVKNDIYRHGIGEFTKGRWAKSAKIFFFGLSTYPAKMIFNVLFLPYFLILCTTPLGAYVSQLIRKMTTKKNASGYSIS